MSDLDAAGFEAAALARVRAHPDHLDLTTFAVMFDLLRASTRIFGQLESAVHRPAGWSLAGFRIMFTLWVAGPLGVRDIARLSGLSRASVSAALNTLERDGLAVRLPHPSDGRLVVVDLTPEGRHRLEAAYAHQNQTERSLLGDLDDDEIVLLTSLLRRLLGSARPNSHQSIDDHDTVVGSGDRSSRPAEPGAPRRSGPVGPGEEDPAVRTQS